MYSKLVDAKLLSLNIFTRRNPVCDLLFQFHVHVLVSIYRAQLWLRKCLLYLASFLLPRGRFFDLQGAVLIFT